MRKVGSEPGPVSQAVAEQAVQWLLALQEDSSRSVLRDWLRWRDASPENAQAWMRIEALHGRLQGVQDVAPSSAQAARAALLARPGNRRRFVVGALVLLLSSGGAWVAFDSQPGRLWTAQVRTGKGERWQQVLDDGSTLTLAGSGALNIRFDTSQRVVELLAGEVFVQTGHRPNEQRPFLVQTRYGSAQALGTRYSVRLLDAGSNTQEEAAQVSVFEGAVRLDAAQPAAGELLLDAGEQALMSKGGYGRRMPADGNRESWQRGMLTASNMRLADFLSELDRFVPFAVECAPALADLRLSGTYPLSRPDDVVFSVARMLGLRVSERRRGWQGRMLYLSQLDK